MSVVYHTFKEKIKIWPLVGLAAIQNGHGGAWRAWRLAHHLDTSGSGKIKKRVLYEFIEGLGVHPRTRRRWVRAAKELGVMAQNGDVYHLRSLGKAAAMFGAQDVGARAGILKGVEKLVTRGWHAHVWATWLAVRNCERTDLKPISQRVKERLSGVPPRTQRKYNQQAGLESRENYLDLGEGEFSAQDIDNLEDITGWHYFVFGKELRQKLPDIVLVDPEHAEAGNKGRSKQARAELEQYSSIGEREALPTDVRRLFYSSFASASRAARKDQDDKLYFARAARGVNLWNEI